MQPVLCPALGASRSCDDAKHGGSHSPLASGRHLNRHLASGRHLNSHLASGRHLNSHSTDEAIGHEVQQAGAQSDTVLPTAWSLQSDTVLPTASGH
jgi:hypothetical protein